MKKYFELIIIVFVIVTFVVCFMSSCNLTRVVTTTAQHYVHGDTTTTIMTKTTESYDGSIKPELLKTK